MPNLPKCQNKTKRRKKKQIESAKGPLDVYLEIFHPIYYFSYCFSVNFACPMYITTIIFYSTCFAYDKIIMDKNYNINKNKIFT
jgi:hypothetical protein